MDKINELLNGLSPDSRARLAEIFRGLNDPKPKDRK